jgi:excisionase family DNA binding protein
MRQDMSEWLSVEDISKELGVHVDTVRGWIRERKLRATRLGREYRIRRVDLDKFLDDRTIEPDEPKRD